MSQQWKVATATSIPSLINSFNILFAQQAETAETVGALRLLTD